MATLTPMDVGEQLLAMLDGDVLQGDTIGAPAVQVAFVKLI